MQSLASPLLRPIVSLNTPPKILVWEPPLQFSSHTRSRTHSTVPRPSRHTPSGNSDNTASTHSANSPRPEATPTHPYSWLAFKDTGSAGGSYLRSEVLQCILGDFAPKIHCNIVSNRKDNTTPVSQIQEAAIEIRWTDNIWVSPCQARCLATDGEWWWDEAAGNVGYLTVNCVVLAFFFSCNCLIQHLHETFFLLKMFWWFKRLKQDQD